MLPRIHLTGNLSRDPELRFTTTGKAVCSFAVACNDRRKVGDRWEDGDTTFLDVTVWGDDAEATANHLAKGQRVTIEGRLSQRSYETRDGDKRTVFEVTAQLLTIPLPRGGADRARTPAGVSAGDPWASPAAPAAPGAAGGDPWVTGTAATPADPPF